MFVILILGFMGFIVARPIPSVNLLDDVSTVVQQTDGQIRTYDSAAFDHTQKGDIVTMTLHMPTREESPFQDAAIAFHLYHCIVDISFEGETIYSYGEDLAEQGKMIGAEYIRFVVPDDAWGKDIQIQLEICDDGSFSSLTELEMYSEADSLGYYFNHGLIEFIISICCFIVTIAMLGNTLTGNIRLRMSRQSLYIAAFAFIVGMWLFSSKGLYNFFWSSYIWIPFEYLVFFLLPVPLCLYFSSFEENRRYRKQLVFLVFANILLTVVATVLDLSNIAHFCQTLPFAHVLIGISLLYLLYLAARGLRHGDSGSGFLLASILSVVLFGLLDLIRFYLILLVPAFSMAVTPSLIPFGIAAFIVFLLLAFFSDVEKTHRESLQHENEAMSVSRTVAQISAGVCVFLDDEDATIASANEYFYALFGYTRSEAEVVGFTNLRFVFKNSDLSVLRGKGVSKDTSDSAFPERWEQEVRVLNKDNKEIDLYIRNCRFDYSNDRIVSTMSDVTALNKTRHELALSESDYRIAVELTDRQMFTYNPTGNTLDFVLGSVDVLGFPNHLDNLPRSLIGLGCIEEADIDELKSFFRQMRSGEPSGDSYIRVRRASDAALRWCQFEYKAAYDARGFYSHSLMSISDVTEQREREMAYRRTEEQLSNRSEAIVASWECNLSTGLVERMLPDEPINMRMELPRPMTEVVAIVSHFGISEESIAVFSEFADVDRLMRNYMHGVYSEQVTLRGNMGTEEHYYDLSCQSVLDPYSRNVKCFMTVRNIDEVKAHEIMMEQRMRELEKELENSRIKVMINQMQPHFLYNALSAIRTITKVNPDYAYDLLYDFTVHLRSSIKALSSDDPIPFPAELSNVKAYLNIEKMRFEHLNVVYDIGCEDFMITPLSIQPLAENAARHGVYPQGSKGGTVTIRTFETEDAYVVQVEDDGTGFDVDKELNTKSDSVGLKNMMFRMKTLMDADVDINSKIGEGTLITVTIPKSSSSQHPASSH